MGLSGKQPASTAPTTTSSQPPPLSNNTPTSSLPSSGPQPSHQVRQSSTLTNATTTVLEGVGTWLTFTNEPDLYSIQYPNSIGALTVEYEPDGGATLTWANLGGDFSVNIDWADNPQYLNLLPWLSKYGWPNPIQALLINGMEAVVYPTSASGVATAFLSRSINGLPYIYEIDFTCYIADGQCSQPPFWLKMLDSFEGLQVQN